MDGNMIEMFTNVSYRIFTTVVSLYEPSYYIKEMPSLFISQINSNPVDRSLLIDKIEWRIASLFPPFTELNNRKCNFPHIRMNFD